MNDEQIKSLGQAITRQHAVAEQLAARVMQMDEVNAELLEALKDARHCIGIDRDTIVDCHTNPCTGYLDPDGALAKAEYDDVIDAADAAIARAESAMPFWPDHSSAISDPLFHQARGIMGTENFGQEEALRLAILHVLNARAESAIETPAMASQTTAAPTAPLKPHVFRQLVNDLRDLAKQYYGHDSLRDRISGRLGRDVPVVGPCQGHAAQQDADALLARIARAIWGLRREEEDRCDMELEDMPHDHSVWQEAKAAIEAMKGGS